MNILILSEDYPSIDNPYALSYIHSRLICYKDAGVSCTVLSFKSESDYMFQGIKVVSSVDCVEKFDAVLSHAPNLRNHVRFILLNVQRIRKLVIWIHGHEVMNVYSEYPKPYTWSQTKRLRNYLHYLYSPIKIFFMSVFFKYILAKLNVKFVFVSNWMRDVFFKNIFHLESSFYEVIPNPVNSNFIFSSFSNHSNSKKLGICVRPWDDSKYAIDMVVDFFEFNPNLKCDIYGKGSYPENNIIPENVKFKSGFIIQSQIPELLNNYHFAILPTRLDAQGVFACELATFGIPLIVNDIPIMREMLSEFPNVLFLDDSDFKKPFLGELPDDTSNIHKFYPDNIVALELDVIYEM